MDISAFENDLNQIKYITRGSALPGFINLLGGEPLLNPDILKYFEIARRIFPDMSINLYTNGTLLPRQEAEFWQRCAELNITIDVTRYPVLTEVDYTHMEKNAQLFCVSLNYRQSKSSFSWTKFPLDITGKQNPTISYMFCLMSSCHQLRYGRLFPCTYIAYIDDFNRAFNQNLEVTERDYLDIYKVTTLEEVKAFLKGPFPFCRYCKPLKKQNVPWRQHGGEKRLEDWI